MLTYLFQSSICLLLFYLVYILLFRRHTHFHFNRAYLLTTMILSMVIPLVNFEIYNETMYSATTVISQNLTTTASVSPSAFSISNIVLILYITGLIISLLIFTYKLISLIIKINRGSESSNTNHRYTQIDGKLGVCSFMKYILIPRNHTPNTYELSHEQSHIDQYHSIDILLAWINQSIFWFNPISYFYLFNMVEVHEFLADQGAIKKLGKTQYQSYILEVLSQKLQPQLAHNFNSIIKTRLTMMNSKSKPRTWSYFAALSVVFTTILLFSCHAKKSALYTWSENGPVEVTTEVVTDTIITIDGDTYAETVSYVTKEVYYVADTIVVFNAETKKEDVTIIKTYLLPEDLIKK